jgi:hypothetical protein
LKPHGGADVPERALRGRQPLLRQIEARAEQPSAGVGPQRGSDGDLAIRQLPVRATVMARDADRASPLLGKLVPSRISTRARAGTTRRNCRQSGSTAHGADVMKC